LISESNFHKIAKRRSAFQLAYIEATFEKEERDKNRLSNLSKDGEDDEICKERCNDMLRKGLDMVKAHLGFASISVPPVVDEYDLLLYCRLDLQHDGCLRKCGFTVQFNMRDFVCKNNYKTMKAMLPCYRYASTRIMNECGAKRCGTLNTSDASFDGYGNRCRVLSCDLNCIQNILIANCGEEYGKQATSLLVQYVRQQVRFYNISQIFY
uniref:DB domain-containing protein n=1 Tax=Syphacia muris TaxID=451379 RepID=A0A0N5AZS4_9BILA